jgi:hypothetical protein
MHGYIWGLRGAAPGVYPLAEAACFLYHTLGP